MLDASDRVKVQIVVDIGLVGRPLSYVIAASIVRCPRSRGLIPLYIVGRSRHGHVLLTGMLCEHSTQHTTNNGRYSAGMGSKIRSRQSSGWLEVQIVRHAVN
jgi:hypothetical protein